MSTCGNWQCRQGAAVGSLARRSRHPEPALISVDHIATPAARLGRAALPSIVAVVAVVALFLVLAHVGPMPGDRRLLAAFPPSPPPPQPLQDLALGFQVAATPIWAAVAVPVTLWLVARGCGRRSAVFVALACVGVLISSTLKAVLGPTPLWTEARGVASGNFPSGHVVYAVVLVGALGILAWERRRFDLVAVAGVVIVMMGPMRLVFGAHLLSDVVAGYLLGAGWLVTTLRLVGTGRALSRGPSTPVAGPGRIGA